MDEISLQLGFLLAAYLRNQSIAYTSPLYRSFAFALILIDALAMGIRNSLHGVFSRGYYVEFFETLKHCFCVFAVAALYIFATQTGRDYSRIILFSTFGLHIVFGYGTRLLWKRYVKEHGKNRSNKRTMLAVLDSRSAEMMLHRLQENSLKEYQVTGIVLNKSDTRKEINGVPIVAELDTAAQYICREWIDSVFIDCPSTDPGIAKLMDDCSQMAIPVHYHIPSVSRDGIKCFTEEIGGIFTIGFTPYGDVELDMQKEEGDLLYDEIGAELMAKEIRRKKAEMLNALSIYFKVTFLHQDAAELLEQEDEED